MTDFFSQIETLLLNMFKLLKNSRFFIQISRFFFKISQIPVFFCLNFQNPGSSMFPGKVVTLVN